ncbi:MULTISPECIES: c-type cytochrome [Campylobacter]|uniref:Monoheme c-type cytochrome n=1 Tax=Campylobacter porcelli TaxID=1660073 RepID=A0A1X9SXZ6_9BACT|nr:MULTISPECIES: hypothetical protein [unclassified Campylobacter]MCR8679344.1 hypothetical protein [Campylobacter sp. RM19072]MCR8696550.1 hypothetical protein [Campylobacter sp. RM19073]MEE3705224.1 hypothetical protein [Campylobacter sp. CX2-8023-23]MEE3744890.1 hypothetical protein [Campylobacter sp. CX2-4855-23]ARR01083.1 monoheme c-type cytochrome [Campylobacter sp. RM6137]
MNLGKILALLLSCLIVILMLFMAFSSDNLQTQEMVATTSKQTQNIFSSKSEFQTNDELNKIKELKQSVSISSDGVSKIYLQSCAPCHAKDGSGIIAPSIIGKSKAEILARLNEYKSGNIPNSLMKGLLDNVSDENLTILAEEISKFK